MVTWSSVSIPLGPNGTHAFNLLILRQMHRRFPNIYAGLYYLLGGTEMKTENNVRRIREERLMSKMELARQAGVSSATIGRIENGEICRMETKRKIILALGYALTDKDTVFPNS